MRVAQTEAEVAEFREGIIRFMSNFAVFNVKQQYLDNKEMFDNHSYNIHDHADETDDEVEATPVRDEDKEQKKETTKEEDAANFPFY